ncbi:MAG: ABC transporter permease [Pseudomonas sp.]|uniref:ABC transporter permease n=1 Tax=Pseudomonas sp. TaxID=306 RepID=UPI003394D3E2
MLHFPISPVEMVASFWRNRSLIRTLATREVLGRYRGSGLGLLWSFLNPVLMLAVYTFVFGVIFNARWTLESDSKAEFALVLFAGLIVFNLFGECLNRAPGLILANVNYVKKVVFPLEVLPWVALVAALFHCLASFVVWLLFYVCFLGMPSPSALLLPLVLVPLVLLTLGLSWGLASLGVYLRDISQIIGSLVTMLMFVSGIFYSVSSVPDKYQAAMRLNPLVSIIEQARDVLIWGRMPDFTQLSIFLGVSLCIAWLGFAWFQKSRRGFADVL